MTEVGKNPDWCVAFFCVFVGFSVVIGYCHSYIKKKKLILFIIYNAKCITIYESFIAIYNYYCTPIFNH